MHFQELIPLLQGTILNKRKHKGACLLLHFRLVGVLFGSVRLDLVLLLDVLAGSCFAISGLAFLLELALRLAVLDFDAGLGVRIHLCEASGTY